MMKKYIIIIAALFAMIEKIIPNTIIKFQKEVVYIPVEIDNQVFEYNKRIKIKDIVNFDTKEYIITDELGEFDYSVKGINHDHHIYNIHYTVVDTTPPIISGSTSITTTKGANIDIVNKYLCGDNYDSKPNCYIEGNYDINKIGTYGLTYIAEDSNGNKSTKNIKLNVIKKTNDSSTSSNKPSVPISDIISKYKNENTKIGVDVSTWQGKVNWEEAKQDGVEFALIRIGFGHNSKNEIVLDNQYLNNIKNAKEAGVPVGLYFYSYAKTKEEAINQAKWIVDTLNGETLDLPIAFDWENWSKFNSYNVSFKEISDIAQAFINELEKHGYKGMLYSSAYYLENMWREADTTWLAYYTSNNDYEGEFTFWQLSSRGKVNGIDGNVDLNVMYLNQ